MLRRSIASMIIAGAMSFSTNASAVELTWSEGTTRIRTYIEAKDYQGAKGVWVVLVKDHPNYDVLFELDMRFAVGDIVDASSLLSSLAYRNPKVLFESNNHRATQWSCFQAQLDALDYYVAEHAGDDRARLVLGYYFLISGMPNRGERIFSRIHAEAPEWRVAQILLDVSQGRIPQYSEPPQSTVIVQDPPKPIVYDPPTMKRPAVPKSSNRFMMKAGSGALFFADSTGNPVQTFNGAIGVRNGKGYSYELQLSSAPQVSLLAGDSRKEVSLSSVGAGISYNGSMPYKASLRPVGGLGAQLVTAAPLGTQTAKALGLSGRVGLELAIPVGRGAVQIGVEGSAQKVVAGDELFPINQPLYLNTATTLGFTF
jgi:hypothetical protein